MGSVEYMQSRLIKEAMKLIEEAHRLEPHDPDESWRKPNTMRAAFLRQARATLLDALADVETGALRWWVEVLFAGEIVARRLFDASKKHDAIESAMAWFGGLLAGGMPDIESSSGKTFSRIEMKCNSSRLAFRATRA